MGEPPITVLIPTYNHEKYIEAAIESVVNQTIFDVCRVIVSDDCSLDNTFQRATRASANFGNITVRRNIRNLGIMPHYATLVASVSTPFVAILEGDDVWLSTRKLELQHEILGARTACGDVLLSVRRGVQWNGIAQGTAALEQRPEPDRERRRPDLRQFHRHLLQLFFSHSPADGCGLSAGMAIGLRLALQPADCQCGRRLVPGSALHAVSRSPEGSLVGHVASAAPCRNTEDTAEFQRESTTRPAPVR